ncbi:hypothetical protein JCM19029_00300 [Salinicoccus sesuvii]
MADTITYVNDANIPPKSNIQIISSLLYYRNITHKFPYCKKAEKRKYVEFEVDIVTLCIKANRIHVSVFTRPNFKQKRKV